MLVRRNLLQLSRSMRRFTATLVYFYSYLALKKSVGVVIQYHFSCKWHFSPKITMWKVEYLNDNVHDMRFVDMAVIEK